QMPSKFFRKIVGMNDTNSSLLCLTGQCGTKNMGHDSQTRNRTTAHTNCHLVTPKVSRCLAVAAQIWAVVVDVDNPYSQNLDQIVERQHCFGLRVIFST